MLFGFTTSFRMGQLLRYALKIPDHDPRVPDDTYMVTTFVNAVRDCLKAHGWAENEKGQEVGGCFLVGYKGRLYEIESDYQVGIPLDNFAAIGCGDQIARGALFASAHLSGGDRILMALKAAERHSAGVRAPFVIEGLVP